MRAMHYVVFVPPNFEVNGKHELIFTDIKDASKALKQYKGSRMKCFHTQDEASSFISDPGKDESFIYDADTSQLELAESLEKLSLGTPKKQMPIELDIAPSFPTPETRDLSNLRRKIEANDYDEVERIIWSNPRCLVTVCDSAVYLMAGPKYNACHIAARSNKPEIIALILDTVSNTSFVKLLYPKENAQNIQDRTSHLLDSYLNTPDPRQGNTPLHFACKLGHHRVVRVLLTFEGCDSTLRDLQGKTAEESICSHKEDGDSTIQKKMKDMFKSHLHLPIHRDQLKKRLLLVKKRNKAGDSASDTSFSDDSFFSPQKSKPVDV